MKVITIAVLAAGLIVSGTMTVNAQTGQQVAPMQNMPGMDGSKMQNMDHSNMPGMANMKGMDHSNTPGMQQPAQTQGTRKPASGNSTGSATAPTKPRTN
jgi:uncharacterized protein involved in copper resistance